MGWLAVPPCNPRQALTLLERTSDKHQETGVAWGSHFPSDDMSLALALHCFAPLGHSEGRLPVERSSYGKHDYAFGQRMLTLRTALGLTQAGLADLLGISRQAMGGWEAGSSYPKAHHLQHLIRLAVRASAFPPAREAEEIRALWKAAHHKVLLDVQRLADPFDVVVFRSLRDAPECSALLEDCLAVLAPVPLPQSLKRRLSLLLEELRSRRVLLVLDNLEVLLEEGDVLGRLRPGFEAYGHLLRQVTQMGHQSCLLLTSREKPASLRALESRRGPVRSLPLSGLGTGACTQLLAEHEVTGSPEERAHLGGVYAGNPLALNIVAETIIDLFEGQIDPFLAGGTVIFGSITELLEEQWARLSPWEQAVLCWLPTLREPVTLEDLLAVLVSPLAHGQVLEAVDGLRRRCLIERGQRAGSFTLQSVVLEYVTSKLVTTASQEIGEGRLERLLQPGLSQPQPQAYLPHTQEP